MEIRKEEKVSKKKLPLKFLTKSLRLPFLGLIFLVVTVFFVSAIFLSRYPNSLSFMGITLNQELQVKSENEELLQEVQKLMSLPTDEKPTIATVTDVDAVSDQPFFKSAQNGDKVLIYTNAKKAILYRPKERRIIEVGAVNINNEQQVQITEEEQSEEENTEGVMVTQTPTPTETTTPALTPTPEEEQVEEASE
jgi:hypothetical protein